MKEGKYALTVFPEGNVYLINTACKYIHFFVDLVERMKDRKTIKMDGRKLSNEEQFLVRETAVRMCCEQEYSKLDAAMALGVGRQSVGKWIVLYEEGGWEGLKLGRRGRRPGEQAKLDAMADTLQLTVNSVLNRGATYPALNTVTGNVAVTAATSLAGSTGSLRVAVTDQTGVVQAFADIDLTTLVPATVAGLMTALNAIAGVAASIDANGNLVVDATNAAHGISLNPMNSSVSGVSATQFFGFNNLFVNPSSGATTLAVNPILLSSSVGLATGTLSSSGTLAIGDHGISAGDASVVTAVIDALTTSQSFVAAGNFTATTTTLANYSGAIISDAAVQASSAQQNAESAEAHFTYLSETMSNLMGVNIDEESANLTALQTSYQANAQVISTVRQLFDSLIQAVR